MGAICCAGAGVAPLVDAVRNGRPGGRWQTFYHAGRECRIPVAAVDELPLHRLSGKVDRSVSLAIAAAAEAWNQAAVTGVPPEEISVLAGTSRGPHHAWVAAESAVRDGRRLPPRMATAGTVASLSGAVAQLLEARGPGMTVSATCASGAVAIASAAELLALERTRIAVAGGADAPLNPAVLLGLQSAGLPGTHDDAARACRPFDRSRDGLLAGEGAAFLVLERASSARERGAAILGILAGWAGATEGVGRAGVATDGHVMARVLRSALDLAGLHPDDIGYVNAHGTGTVMNDAAEAAALETVFRGVPPVSSTKAVTGHCLGASPALEAVICLESMRHSWLPESVNTVDPCCPLPFVTGTGRPAALRHTLSGSLGFWGCHAALVFSAAPIVAINSRS
jgi:3-oxoacyl-[acyl-carrier-protein] synthase II